MGISRRTRDDAPVNLEAQGAINVAQPAHVTIHNIHFYDRQTQDEANAAQAVLNARMEERALNPDDAPLPENYRGPNTAGVLTKINRRFKKLDDAIAEMREEVANTHAEMRQEIADTQAEIAEEQAEADMEMMDDMTAIREDVTAIRGDMTAIREDIAGIGRLVLRAPLGTAANPIEVMSDSGSDVVRRISETSLSRVEPSDWSSEASVGLRSSVPNKRKRVRNAMAFFEDTDDEHSVPPLSTYKKRRAEADTENQPPESLIRQVLEDAARIYAKERPGDEALASAIGRAKKGAIKAGSSHVADVIDQLYQWSLKNPSISNSLQNVLARTTDEKEIAEFQVHSGHAAKEVGRLRREKKAEEARDTDENE